MKLRFTTKEEAIKVYQEMDGNFTKGEFVTLYKAIVGHTPKKGKSRLDMQNTIEKEIKTHTRG